jgi:RNA polymerase-binding transcription factor DksA
MDGRYQERLTRELAMVTARLRGNDGARIERHAEVIEVPVTGDSMDGVRAALDRDIDLATRSLLVVRTRQLARALDRVGQGRYGTCEECGGAIAPARLAALPEVTTCVRCQDALEREARATARREAADADRFELVEA